ncbi:AAA family ATPase [Pontibacter sp. JAM-7]|uniref:AAA family ATPase n=1 Tax=Pontibacter sp. JAM-7 TaxID=3366581 RepID=UPI003AF57FAC
MSAGTSPGNHIAYFEPPSRLQLLEKLQHLVHYSDFLLLVTGEEGAGKTTLIQQLIPPGEDPALAVCAIELSMPTKDRELLPQLVSQLPQHETVGDGYPEQLQLFQAQLQALSSAGQKCLILIDNAELLNESALDLLLNLHAASGEDQQVQLVLFAEANFAARLAKNELIRHLEGRIHNLLLVGMKGEEVSEFMDLCLPQAARLSMQRRDEIIQQSGGMPGKVVELLAAGESARNQRLFPLPPLHMAGIAVMLLLVLMLSMWQFIPGGAEIQTADIDRVALPLTVEVAPSVDKGPAPTLAMTEPQVPLVSPQPKPAFVQPASDTVVRPGQVAAANSSQAPATTELTQASAAATSKPATQQSIPVAAQPKIQTEPALLPPQKTDKVAETSPVVSPVPAEPEIVARKAPESVLSKNEQSLLSWPARAYTLQIMGSRKEASARTFIQAQSMPEDFYYFATQYKAKPWYVVVYGQYSNRDAATSAIRTLPAELKNIRPWARSLQSVHLDIKKKTSQ